MKKISLLISSILALTVLSSCSVIMAARKDGTSISKVQSCRTRSQIICSVAGIISSERLPSGELVEVYQVQRERGSAGRAMMHALLDVGTCGLWEVVGTPMEAVAGEKEFFILKVTYDEQDRVSKVELI